MVIISTKGHDPFEVHQIPEKYVKKAERELMETEENRSAALNQLREFVLAENLVSSHRVTDDFLLQFLRARKFNIPRSLSLVKKFCYFKKKNPALFTDYNYDLLASLLEKKAFGFVPYRCQDGCAIFAIHLDRWHPSEVSIDHLKKLIALVFYHSIRDPLNQVNGYKVLFDVTSHGLKHLRHCTPQNLYTLYMGTQECFPGRFKGIHVINMSVTFKTAYALIYPFLSEKIKNRIIFHKDNESLKKYFSEDILPVDFGGHLKDYDTLPWLKRALLPDSLDQLAN